MDRSDGRDGDAAKEAVTVPLPPEPGQRPNLVTLDGELKRVEERLLNWPPRVVDVRWLVNTVKDLRALAGTPPTETGVHRSRTLNEVEPSDKARLDWLSCHCPCPDWKPLTSLSRGQIDALMRGTPPA